VSVQIKFVAIQLLTVYVCIQVEFVTIESLTVCVYVYSIEFVTIKVVTQCVCEYRVRDNGVTHCVSDCVCDSMSIYT